MKNQEQKVKEILQNLPKNFTDLYDIKIFVSTNGDRLNLDLNRISLPIPTEIRETNDVFEFSSRLYSLTLWKNSEIKHLCVFEQK